MDFKSLPYKKRTKYILIGTVIFLLVIYLLAIKKTVNLYQQNKTLTRQVDLAKDAPRGIKGYQERINDIDSKLSHYISEYDQEYVLELVSNFCLKHHLLLSEFPKSETQEESDLLIETSTITAEGGFTNLLRLVYELEQNQNVGRISSVEFKTKKDFSRRKRVLFVTIYLQNIKPVQNESKET